MKVIVVAWPTRGDVVVLSVLIASAPPFWNVDSVTSTEPVEVPDGASDTRYVPVADGVNLNVSRLVTGPSTHSVPAESLTRTRRVAVDGRVQLLNAKVSGVAAVPAKLRSRARTELVNVVVVPAPVVLSAPALARGSTVRVNEPVLEYGLIVSVYVPVAGSAGRSTQLSLISPELSTEPSWPVTVRYGEYWGV